jgi:prepilin-type N-terminal cleavage/methylation domain-containing protein/prepilin-type processing-associated H-X9-DG protein
MMQIQIQRRGATQATALPGAQLSSAGFTLVELLMVMAIIGLLAASLLPALTRIKARTRTAHCLNNYKQLTIAWLMYPGDNQDNLVNNHTKGEAECGADAWISSGWQNGLSWTGNARTDATNLAITSGALYAYNNTAALYHCPADTSHLNGKPGLTRFRSVSMSTGMNWLDDEQPEATNATFIRLTQIMNPDPSLALVFVDEAANSIDNNAMGIYPGTDADLFGGQLQYWNLPTTRHEQGCTVSFADGHAEHWKWRDHWVADGNAIPDDPSAAISPARSFLSHPRDRDLQRLKISVPAVRLQKEPEGRGRGR